MPVEPSHPGIIVPRPSARLGYLLHTFPAYSSTFVVEEIESMRRLGADIQIFAIHIAEAEDMPRNFEPYAKETKSVFPISIPALISEHLKALFSRPVPYGKTLWAAMTKGGPMTLKDRLRTLAHWLEAPRLFRLFRQASVDHVHVHFLFAAASVMFFVNRIYGMPYSLTAHGSDIFVEKLLQREKLSAARFTRVMTSFNQDALAQLFPGNNKEAAKLLLIPLGVQNHAFAGELTRPERFTFLHVGRMVWQKGQRQLLEACRTLLDKGKTFRLILVGDGVLKNDIVEWTQELGLKDVVNLTGALPKGEILKLYRSSDCFVLSSISEGSPAVLIEAMLEGQPVIAPRLHGIPEMFKDGQEGWLFEPGNAVALAKAMEDAIEKRDVLQRMGGAARNNAREKFDLEQNTRHFYCQIISVLE